MYKKMLRTIFQSTPSCEGRPRSAERQRQTTAFQSTPSCEGRLQPSVRRGMNKVFQSTPSCEGRLAFDFTVVTRPIISIHALVRGATCCCTCCCTGCCYFNPRPRARGDQKIWSLHTKPAISIHALVRGATEKNSSILIIVEFQSTPSCEGRHLQESLRQKRHGISIHALVRGATFGH